MYAFSLFVNVVRAIVTLILGTTPVINYLQNVFLNSKANPYSFVFNICILHYTETAGSLPTPKNKY